MIGVVGGGQLARMIGTAAACLGYRMHVFCPDADSPAFHVAGNYAPPPSPFQTTHRGS